MEVRSGEGGGSACIPRGGTTANTRTMERTSPEGLSSVGMETPEDHLQGFGRLGDGKSVRHGRPAAS